MPIDLYVARRRVLSVFLISALLCAGMLATAPPAFAATIVVDETSDTIADDGECSLREAVIAANTNAPFNGCESGENGHDTISINPGLYELTIEGTDEDGSQTGDLDVLESVSFVSLGENRDDVVIDAGNEPFSPEFCLAIGGPGSTAGGETSGPPLGKGGGVDRVLHILQAQSSGGAEALGSSSYDVTVDGITIRGGYVVSNEGPGPAGGGILNEGSYLTIRDSVVEDNQTIDIESEGGGALGGGVGLIGIARLRMVDSVVRRNAAASASSVSFGGGVANQNFLAARSQEQGPKALVQALGDAESDPEASPPLGQVADVAIDGTVFRRNIVCSPIFSSGGGLSSGEIVEIDESTFVKNIAASPIASGGGAEVGGGFFPFRIPGDGSTDIRRSVFKENIVATLDFGSGSVFGPLLGAGGGLTNTTDIGVQMTTFKENLVEVENLSESGNQAFLAGGGMASSSGWAIVTRSTFEDNAANGGGFAEATGLAGADEGSPQGDAPPIEGSGGGLYSASLTEVENSTLSGNVADLGGGLFHESQNEEQQPAGQEGPQGGPADPLRLTFSTVTANSAPEGGGVYVAGEGSNPGRVELFASIIAMQEEGPDCEQFGEADLLDSQGFNLDSDDTCDLNQPQDLPNTDPMLEELASNGGPTKTHALDPSSPAVDHAHPKFCSAYVVDQRGVDRPQDGDGDSTPECDVGAYELAPEEPVDEFCPGFQNDPRPQLVGTGGANTLEGTSADEIICGLGGDDELLGRGGADLVIGGNGNDDMRGGSGNDVMRGSGGNDVMFGDNGDDRIRGFTGVDELYGLDGDDDIGGGRFDDLIEGGSGDDVVLGWGGQDAVFGNQGADDVQGTGKDDVLSGGSGPDVVRGNFGDDEIDGNAGNDKLVGFYGDDHLDGGADNDDCFGGPGTNTLVNCQP